MTNTLTTTVSKTDLADLAAQINAEHAAAETAARAAIQHALECGRLLREAKRRLKHGQWLPWLKANCQVKERQAQNYMRVAENWTVIEKSAPGADLTLKGALQPLEGPENTAPKVTAAVDVYLDVQELSEDHAAQLRHVQRTLAGLETTFGESFPGADGT